MKDICKGCHEKVMVIEYINNGVNHGVYCVDCMTCCRCGTILSVNRLAYMDVHTDMKTGKMGKISVPARWCEACIKKDPKEPEISYGNST